MLQENVFEVWASHWRVAGVVHGLLWSLQANVTWEFNTPHCNTWSACESYESTQGLRCSAKDNCASVVPRSGLSQRQHGPSSKCLMPKERLPTSTLQR